MEKAQRQVNDVSVVERKSERSKICEVLSLELWIILITLFTLGLIFVYSASSAYALKKGYSSFAYAVRQGIYIVGSIVLIMIMQRIPTDMLFRRSRAMLLIIVVLLAGLLIPGVGVTYNQACRWYQLPGGIHIQPAEYAKIIWIIYLSDSIARRKERLGNFFEGLFFYTILTGFIGGLILKEPDFGNAFIVGLISLVLFAAAGVPWKHFSMYIPIGIGVFYFFVYRVPYRWVRITATYNPWTNPLKEGYHLIQAWTGIGAGGLTGQGLGMGIQKLSYIPEPFTDVIFAIIGHETGFIGIAFTVLLFFMLFIVLRRIVLIIKDFRKKLLALGITTLITMQAAINMAVVMGILPTKGLPLSFISYGGSSLMAMSMALGIVMRLLKEEASVDR
ncbi:MAG: putative lipid II flippase FtsW [Syntrophobacterales bacterium]|nr:putative lipid II flippase FtsW [Syntrophobacterales bacterium]